MMALSSMNDLLWFCGAAILTTSTTNGVIYSRIAPYGVKCRLSEDMPLFPDVLYGKSGYPFQNLGDYINLYNHYMHLNQK